MKNKKIYSDFDIILNVIYDYVNSNKKFPIKGEDLLHNEKIKELGDKFSPLFRYLIDEGYIMENKEFKWYRLTIKGEILLNEKRGFNGISREINLIKYATIISAIIAMIMLIMQISSCYKHPMPYCK